MIELKERHQRVEMPIERLLQVEDLMARFLGDGTAIQTLYRKWSAGCQEFDNMVVTAASDPILYYLPNHKGQMAGVWPSRFLKDFPARHHGRMCAIEYAQCKRLMLPMAHYIRHSYGIKQREYFRLVVPLSGDRLAYTTRALMGPNVPVPPSYG